LNCQIGQILPSAKKKQITVRFVDFSGQKYVFPSIKISLALSFFPASFASRASK